MRKNCLKSGLEDVDGFITKCIQLYETTVVRHGLMLVGPTGSGKTRVSWSHCKILLFFSINEVRFLSSPGISSV